MTLSISRYSHLLLAASSALFLLIAALTGSILSFEPIIHSVQPYKAGDLEKITLEQTVTALKASYDEVISLEVDPDGFVTAAIITKEGAYENNYIDPSSAKKIGTPQNSAPIFTFAKNLHRSLFLKSLGRFFVGLISLLLVLIAGTGFLLLLKRQGGIRRLFKPIEKDYFELRYHVILSRWFIIPLLIIAGTGVFLSAENFSLLPSTTIEHAAPLKTTLGSSEATPLFKTTSLGAVRKVNFPFSEAETDYYEIALYDRELLVHQYSQEIISEVKYPWVVLTSRISFLLHTGQGNILWAIVLLLTSLALLFFMYSGFAMTFRRLANKITLPTAYSKDKAEYIILVGSETGSTFKFANILSNALIQAGEKVFVAQLNKYTTYKKAKQLVVLTATYGKGEAPSNAQKFEEQIQKTKPLANLNFSVVGFGSLSYPDYCQFAIEIATLLEQHPNFKTLLPLHKINNASMEDFQEWGKQWSAKLGLDLPLEEISNNVKPSESHTYSVVKKTTTNSDTTFLLHLKPLKKYPFQSGDLLAITPKGTDKESYYSIGKVADEMVFSIKKQGNCSTYLSSLNPEDKITARLQRNSKFYFPQTAKTVIFIANGTGIAPFLGMLHENTQAVETYLFWGGRTKKSLELYQPYINNALSKKQLTEFYSAFSKETEQHIYVQHKIAKKATLIAKTLQQGGTIMLCGSIDMQKGVLIELEKISNAKLGNPLKEYELQLKMDCY